jgi:hypothetical protein
MSPRTVVIVVFMLSACLLVAVGMLAILSVESEHAVRPEPSRASPVNAAAPSSGASCEATAADRQVALPPPSAPGRALPC